MSSSVYSCRARVVRPLRLLPPSVLVITLNGGLRTLGPLPSSAIQYDPIVIWAPMRYPGIVNPQMCRRRSGRLGRTPRPSPLWACQGTTGGPRLPVGLRMLGTCRPPSSWTIVGNKHQSKLICFHGGALSMICLRVTLNPKP